MYRIQTGKNKGSYENHMSFGTRNRAILWYNGIVVHSGGKKRLLDPNGKVIAREIT